MSAEEELQSRAYTACNAQDVDGLLALVSDDGQPGNRDASRTPIPLWRV